MKRPKLQKDTLPRKSCLLPRDVCQDTTLALSPGPSEAKEALRSRAESQKREWGLTPCAELRRNQPWSKNNLTLLFLPCLLLAACSKHPAPTPLTPQAYGAQIVEVSGGKQVTGVGSQLPQPIVVQVNGADGNPVTGALVFFRGEDTHPDLEQALSDSSGQVTVAVRLGSAPGDYQIVAETPKSGGGNAAVTLRETALGYEQKLGSEVNDKYCNRCHDNESTPEQVSNFDNLTPAPHLYTDGATYNRFSDADLLNIITRGGPALGKSPQMPAYGSTLKPAEIKALIAYIRAMADPPYQASGVKYGQ